MKNIIEAGKLLVEVSLELVFLVYCSKCGFKNEDDAEVCSKCGASFQISRVERRRGRRERRVEDECFGLPYGRAIAAIVFGIIILVWGFSLLTGINIWSNIFFIIVIIFGTLIIAGSIYAIARR